MTILKLLYKLPLKDRFWACKDCDTFVIDKLPWPCGVCGARMKFERGRK